MNRDRKRLITQAEAHANNPVPDMEGKALPAGVDGRHNTREMSRLVTLWLGLATTGPKKEFHKPHENLLELEPNSTLMCFPCSVVFHLNEITVAHREV